jgi:hypothetical protein
MSQKLNKDQMNDTGWINITLTSGFVTYTADTVPKYRRVGNRVEMRGALKPTGTATTVNITTLPLGFRPQNYQAVFRCQGSNNETWCMQVYMSGLVVFERYSGTITTSIWLPFNVSFFID